MPISKKIGIVLRYLRVKYHGAYLTTPPTWLKRSPWKPICIRLPGDPRTIAVDLVLSGALPRTLYRREVHRLLTDHPELRVIVCTSEEGILKHPALEQVAKEMGFGVMVLIPSFGLETAVSTDLDRQALPPQGQQIAPPQQDLGWFPAALLSTVTGLSNLSYSSVLDKFVRNIQAQPDPEKTLPIVRKTLDMLLQSHLEYGPDIARFMKLDHFERLLRSTLPQATDHVFHSFRVFLAGCPVINQFYTHFQKAHRRFCIGSQKNLSVEYSWLLASIFHDIGRPKEQARAFLEKELDDDDVQVTVQLKNTKWTKEEYAAAKRMLGSLGVFVGSVQDGHATWDGGTLEDQSTHVLSEALSQVYDSLSNHGVISAFELLADIFLKARAADNRKYRPFVVTHAVPAALAIILHDWHLWEQAKQWGLFPIDGDRLPMAALLIYADGWDDYRRKNQPPPVAVESYKINSRGAEVVVRWSSIEAYEKEQIKYQALKKALKKMPFKLVIKPYTSTQL